MADEDASVCSKNDKDPTKDRVAVTQEFFSHTGPAAKADSSLFRCRQCPQVFRSKPCEFFGVAVAATALPLLFGAKSGSGDSFRKQR
jgi:hypothetical protein